MKPMSPSCRDAARLSSLGGLTAFTQEAARWWQLQYGSFPLQLPLLPPLPSGQVESCFQQQELELGRVGKSLGRV